MNWFLFIALSIYVVLDTIMIRKYENNIKELTEENKKLKKTLENAGV